MDEFTQRMLDDLQAAGVYVPERDDPIPHGYEIPPPADTPWQEPWQEPAVAAGLAPDVEFYGPPPEVWEPPQTPWQEPAVAAGLAPDTSMYESPTPWEPPVPTRMSHEESYPGMYNPGGAEVTIDPNADRSMYNTGRGPGLSDAFGALHPGVDPRKSLLWDQIAYDPAYGERYRDEGPPGLGFELTPETEGARYAELFKALGGYRPPYVVLPEEELHKIGAAYQSIDPATGLPSVFGPPQGLLPNTLAHEYGHVASQLEANRRLRAEIAGPNLPYVQDWQPVYRDAPYGVQSELMRRRGLPEWNQDWREQEADLFAGFPHGGYPEYYDPANARPESWAEKVARTPASERGMTPNPDRIEDIMRQYLIDENGGYLPAPGGVVGGTLAYEDSTLRDLEMGGFPFNSPAKGWGPDDLAFNYWDWLWRDYLTRRR